MDPTEYWDILTFDRPAEKILIHFVSKNPLENGFEKKTTKFEQKCILMVTVVGNTSMTADENYVIDVKSFKNLP